MVSVCISVDSAFNLLWIFFWFVRLFFSVALLFVWVYECISSTPHGQVRWIERETNLKKYKIVCFWNFFFRQKNKVQKIRNERNSVHTKKNCVFKRTHTDMLINVLTNWRLKQSKTFYKDMESMRMNTIATTVGCVNNWTPTQPSTHLHDINTMGKKEITWMTRNLLNFFSSCFAFAL